LEKIRFDIGRAVMCGSFPRCPESDPAIDPRAAQNLKEMSNYVGGFSQFALRTRNSIDLGLKGGQKITLISSSRSSIRRPDRVMSERLGEHSRLRLFFDGNTANLLDLKGNHYAQRDFDDDLYKVLDYLRVKAGQSSLGFEASSGPI
jgi:hypothetical protein